MSASVLATVLFWVAALAVVVAQVMILRSTRRALGALRAQSAGSGLPLREWAFAVGPALLLALVLVLSWRAATRPPVVDVRFGPVAGAGGRP
jgi:heme/copper-type cytochrome/quinol oxidase subunit 2